MDSSPVVCVMRREVQRCRFAPFFTGALAFVVASTLASCEPNTAGPEQAYNQFFDAMWLYVQKQYDGQRQVAFDTLAQASRKELESRADSLNNVMPEGIHFEPSDLLVPSALPFGAPHSKVEVIAISEDNATLRVLFNGGEDEVELVREAGEWKVMLQLRSPPTQQKRAAESLGS